MQVHAITMQNDHCWRFERPAMVTPRQMLMMFIGFVLVLQVIGVGFSLAGAEPILGFAWLELLFIGLVLWAYSRHLQDAETLALEDSRLFVNIRDGSSSQCHEFTRAWAQVNLTGDDKPLVRIHEGRKDIHVGRFVPPHQRADLARALRQWIKGEAHV